MWSRARFTYPEGHSEGTLATVDSVAGEVTVGPCLGLMEELLSAVERRGVGRGPRARGVGVSEEAALGPATSRPCAPNNCEPVSGATRGANCDDVGGRAQADPNARGDARSLDRCSDEPMPDTTRERATSSLGLRTGGGGGILGGDTKWRCLGAGD